MSESHVVYITEHPYKDLWYEGEGWYYVDETGELNGPYSTKPIALFMSDEYETWLKGVG